MSISNPMLLPIPEDWDGVSWNCGMIEYPDSPQWRAIILGKVAELGRGRKWDGNTGSIKDAQAIADQIYERFTMGCGEDLNRIAEALYVDFTDSQGQAVEWSISQILHNASKSSMLTSAEIVGALEDLDPGLFGDIQDLHEVMQIISSILPNIDLPNVFGLLQAIVEIRYKRDMLAQAKMNTLNGRYIGRALSGSVATGAEEEAEFNSRMAELLKSPWLLTAVAVLDPSPTGEIALAARLAGIASSAWSFVTGIVDKILAGEVTDPGSPKGNVVEAINNLGKGLKDITVNVSDCADCGDDYRDVSVPGSPGTNLVVCGYAKWYVGIIIEFLWTLSISMYAEDPDNDIVDDSNQWSAAGLTQITNFLSSLTLAYFSGENLKTDENLPGLPKAQPSVTFISDYGRSLGLSQDKIGLMSNILRNGLSRYETGQVYSPARGDYIDVPVQVVYRLDTMDYLTSILDNQQELINVITGAIDASDLQQSLVAFFEAYVSPPFLDGGVEYKPARRAFSDILTDQTIVNKMFGQFVTEAERDRYSWRVSGTCDDYDFDCFPTQFLQAYGTPLLYSGNTWDLVTYPVGTWVTITSEFLVLAGDGSHQRIGSITLDNDYTVEIEILTLPVGKSLNVTIADCVGEYIVNDNYTVPQALYLGSAHNFLIMSDPTEAQDPGSFTIRIRRLT